MQIIDTLKSYKSFVFEQHGEGNWITVYKSNSIEGQNDETIYCALVSKEATKKAMQSSGWDVRIGTDMPGFVCSYCSGEELATYFPNTSENFLRLVFVRDFYGRVEGYVEILEEFRLLYNLYYDVDQRCFFDFDDSGEAVEVIKIEEKQVRIRSRYLKSFMATKQMNLLLYFESTWHTAEPTTIKEDFEDINLTYSVYTSSPYIKGYTALVRITGKKLLHCEAVDTCNIWPYEKVKNYQSFIIGGDEDSPMEFTSDPDKLANNFGKNQGSPHYLTPVFFRNEVMQKYYGNSKYTVEDGRIIRNGSWTLRCDNNSKEHISVFLGNLGRDLPEKEQLYWKSFNIIPDGRKISKTNFHRNIMGMFVESEKIEHLFKLKFKSFQKLWWEKYNWNFFLPLAKKDEHFFESIRTLLSNEQQEFDAQILGLAKVTIDSVNVKNISQILQTDETKSINLILILLENSSKVHEFSELLRGVQSIRSTGVAHRKGKEYEKQMIKYAVNDKDYSVSFDKFLSGYVELFGELELLEL